MVRYWKYGCLVPQVLAGRRGRRRGGRRGAGRGTRRLGARGGRATVPTAGSERDGGGGRQPGFWLRELEVGGEVGGGVE